MTIDITSCSKVNIIDSCSIWNLLSSLTFYSRVNDSDFIFSTTKYVEYECLYKTRTNPTIQDEEIKHRLLNQKKNNRFPSHNLSIDDLQDDEILTHSKQLGVGELSSIAFCKKTNQVFLTDDQKARRIAKLILGSDRVQTIPHILGWLFYKGLLSDIDLQPIIDEHNSFGRPLEQYFRIVYDQALRIRCLFG